MTDRVCPTETAEEITLSQYLDSRGFTHWHIPQETFTTSWKQKAKNKAMGVVSGPSDHWLILPTPPHPNGTLLAIELKRQFGNTPTDEQIKFMHNLEKVDNCGAVCCYGADEAIKVIEELERGEFETYDRCWERTLKIEENRKNKRKSPKKPQKSENDLPY